MASRRSSILVAVAVFVAAMGLYSEHRSFPFYYHPDEPGKVLQLIQRRRNFHHPTLLLTTADLVRITSLHGGAQKDPQKVVEMGRLVVAAFAAASAALLALLAVRLHGLSAGLAAGLLVVVNPLLYELAHYFKEDPAFLFGIVACALAAERASTRRDARSLALLGAAAGVAAAGKYVGVALVPVAAVIAAGTGGGSARERWKRVGAVAGGALLAWLALDWWVFRKPALVGQSLGVEMSNAFVAERGLLKRVPHAYYFGVQGRYGGAWAPALAALWLAFAACRPRRVSVAEWLLTGVSLASLAVLSFTPRTETRYYLPIAVGLCYLAAAGAFHWAALASARLGRWRPGAAVVAVALCVGVAWQQWSYTEELRRGFQQDDRAELVKAVAALPPTAIVAQDEAAGLPEPDRRWEHEGRKPLQQAVIGARQAPDLGSLADLRARGVTHLALCERNFGRYLAADRIVKDPDSVMPRRAFYRTALERGHVLREWKPGRVAPLQPGLVLVDISGLE